MQSFSPDDNVTPECRSDPGSKNKEHIVENLNALQVELTDAEFAALENALNQHKVYGHRGFGGF